MNNLYIKNCLACLLLVWPLISGAQDLHLKKGTVTDSVPIPGSELLHYAIYLPENYTEENQWPVIFVFDTEGKGKEALEAFTAAPGASDFILVGSNNAINTSYEANFYLAKRLFELILGTFPVDKRRIYTAGFAGGGRLATAIATISKDVKGVIACGAAMPGNQAYAPKKNDFLFVGMVGDEAGTYREMIATVNDLYRKKFNADLLLYEGNAHYPPAADMDRAIRALLIKSIAKGAFPVGGGVIDSLYREDMTFNRKLEEKGEALNAFNDVNRLMGNYSGFTGKDGLKERRKEIRKNKTFRKQRNDNYGIYETEENYIMDYMAFLSEDITAGNIDQLPSWEEEIIALEKLEKGNNPARGKMARRLKDMLKSVTLETLASWDENAPADRLLFTHAFVVLLDPKAEDSYIEILKHSVGKGEYGMAFFYLEKLLQNGFADVEKLNKEEGMALLRIQPEYNEILREYGLETLY